MDFLLLILQWLFIQLSILIQKHSAKDYLRNDEKNYDYKYILLWSLPKYKSVFHDLDKSFKLDVNWFYETGCPVYNCYFTANRTFFQDSRYFDVILFFGVNLANKENDLRDAVEVKRSLEQHFIFFSQESPSYYPLCKNELDGFFNITWTFKLNSNLLYSYFIIKNKSAAIIGPNEDMHWIKLKDMKPIDYSIEEKLQYKWKAVAWIVSNCNSLSPRFGYVNKLNRALGLYGLTVDIYGGCGIFTCGKNNSGLLPQCWDIIERDYLFYLSFENSFSEDYVTEKVYNPLKHYTVPIVYGTANYTRFMPDGAYLNAMKLSPILLASKVMEAMENRSVYQEYFKWHNHYSYHNPDDNPKTNNYCRLCEMVNDYNFMNSIELLKHFRLWWNGIDACGLKEEYKWYESRDNLRKNILLWSLPPFSTEWKYACDNGRRIFDMLNCPVHSCFLTADRNFFDDVTYFDVILFNGISLFRRRKEFIEVHKMKRTPEQNYIFFMRESPSNYPLCHPQFDGFFNITWTYKLNSDLLYPFFVIRNEIGDIIGPHEKIAWMQVEDMTPIDFDTEEKLKHKFRAAAWIVSNCRTKNRRFEYFNKLRAELLRYELTIDVFGKCGKLTCGNKALIEPDCWEMIQNDYYFYLSFENAFGEDYVTDKVLNPLKHYTVPIVYGSANYSRFMPDGIYLNAMELSPAVIAFKMNEAIQNKEIYHNYFRWRNHYTYHSPGETPQTNNFCRLCEMVNENVFMTATKGYREDFVNWWNGIGECEKVRYTFHNVTAI